MRKKNVTFPINVIIENQPINLATERVELSVNNEDGKLGDVVILLFFSAYGHHQQSMGSADTLSKQQNMCRC